MVARPFDGRPQIALLRRDADFLGVPRQSKKRLDVDPSNQPSGVPEAEEVVEQTALGRRIEARVRDLRLKKAEVMRRVGVKRWATIQEWIRGDYVPKAINLIRLAEALEMDPIALMDELLPEPDTDAWRTFKARNADRISLDDLVDMRMMARRRPHLTARALEAALSVLQLGAPDS